MPPGYSLRPNFRALISLRPMVLCAVLLTLPALSQDPVRSPSLQGIIRGPEGKPIAQATVELQRSDSTQNLHVESDSEGKYSFQNAPDGIYVLRAAKAGYAAEVPSIFLNRGNSRTIDLTLAAVSRHAPAETSPQFFDQPQFTVSGVTDTTNLGGHGSDTVVRARDSLAKDTALLGEKSARPHVDLAREKSLREDAERRPADFAANSALGHFLVGTGRAREAIPFLERAAEKEPANFENGYDLAFANAQAGNNALAREQATKLLAGGERAEVHHLLGDVDESLGDSLEAVRHYQRAAELQLTESHLFDWGAELLLHHAPEPALEVFSKGSKLYPSSARMLLGLGAAYFARGAYDEALTWISAASDLNPEDSAPYQFLGKIEQVVNTPSAALVDKLHRFVSLQPRNASANYYYAVGLWKLRKAAPEKSNVAEVESLLKTAVEIDPKHAAAELQLGILHSDVGAYAQAIADFQKALEADPQMEEAHYRLAQAYRLTGDSDRAKEELRLYQNAVQQSAQQQDRERREIKQFVYTLRDRASPSAR